MSNDEGSFDYSIREPFGGRAVDEGGAKQATPPSKYTAKQVHRQASTPPSKYTARQVHPMAGGRGHRAVPRGLRVTVARPRVGAA